MNNVTEGTVTVVTVDRVTVNIVTEGTVTVVTVDRATVNNVTEGTVTVVTVDTVSFHLRQQSTFLCCSMFINIEHGADILSKCVEKLYLI